MSMIVREIVFKRGEGRKAQRLLEKLDSMDKLAACRIDEEGRKCLTARFDDEMDYLAFLVSIGGAKIVKKGASDERETNRRL